MLTKMITTEEVTPTKVGTKWSSGSITCCRTSGTVTLKFGGAAIGSISSRTQIATIPEGFRPPTQIVLTTYGGLDVIVNTNGSLQVDPPAGATYYGSVTYVAKLGGVIRTLKNAISNLYREGVAVC